jgi:CHAD domain-containing protein
MRLALTRLRAMIAFFSPMVAGPQRTRIHEKLKWLNSHLGVVRDLDVALERLKEFDQRRPQMDYRFWKRERDQSQRHLTRALQSTQYRRLVTSTSDWIERGSWLTKKGNRAAARRACPIAEYAARKLTRWQERLITKSRKLQDMGVKKRHRLRLLNKKLSNAIETLKEVVSNDELARQQLVKYLRKTQRALGQLNDDAQGRALAATMGRSGVRASRHFLSPKREKRLLRSAAFAYRKLAELEPFRTRGRRN